LSILALGKSILLTATIAGCYVTNGKIERNAGVRVMRDNVLIYTSKISIKAISPLGIFTL
ncbi:hypothetical protein, partial [Brachyspira hyodysenteriae]|uniref:hypothetical protein n=1 Tax=Brachyspira hyodysenteriae TaxID=159 RepID=UPI001A7E0943